MAPLDDQDLIARLDRAIDGLKITIAADIDSVVAPINAVDINYLIGLAVASLRGDATIRRLADSGHVAPGGDRPEVLARDLLISANLARRALAS